MALEITTNDGKFSSVKDLIKCIKNYPGKITKVSMYVTSEQDWPTDTSSLKENRGVTSFEVRESDLNDKAIATIIALVESGLTELTISGCSLEKGKIATILTAVAKSSVTKLGLLGCVTTQADWEAVANLLKVGHITEGLDLSGNSINLQKMQVLASGLVEKSPAALTLVSCHIDDQQAQLLAKVVKKSPALKVMTLARNGMTKVGGSALVEAFKQGEKLDLSNNEVDKDDITAVVREKTPHLTLNLSDQHDRDAPYIVKATAPAPVVVAQMYGAAAAPAPALAFEAHSGLEKKFTTIVDLLQYVTQTQPQNLIKVVIQDIYQQNWPKAAVVMDHLRNVKTFEVCESSLDDNAVATIIELIKLGVTKLTLSGCSAEEGKIAQIINALKNSSVTKLDLSGSGGSRASLEALSQFLQGNHNLTELNLSGNSLKVTKLKDPSMPQKIKILADGLEQASGLDMVVLARCGIDDEGAAILAYALKKASLKGLDLSGNGIKEEGAKSLAEVFGHCSLEKLNLSKNCISSEGVGRATLVVKHAESPHVTVDLSNQDGKQKSDVLTASIPVPTVHREEMKPEVAEPSADKYLV